MEIDLSSADTSLAEQATAAGYSDVGLYVQSLIERDAERLAILKGMEDRDAGRTRPFEEFDREFREKNGLPPRV